MVISIQSRDSNSKIYQ